MDTHTSQEYSGRVIQLLVEAVTYTTQKTQEKNIHTEPPIPEAKQLQTCALHRTATGIGDKYTIHT
jgi:hypothetical protein